MANHYNTQSLQNIIDNQRVKCTNETKDTQVISERKEINVVIALFFDGTLNNKYNIELRIALQKNKAAQDAAIRRKRFNYRDFRNYDEIIGTLSKSYFNSFTNIFHLWDLFLEEQGKNVMKIYVEGPGTAEPITNSKGETYSIGDEDSGKGAGFGTGEQGVNGKIKEACKLIISKLRKFNRKTINLNLRVFGFSRGATEARRFVSIVGDLSQKDESLIYVLNNNLPGLKINNIKVDIMGLFDTVSSYGFLNNLNYGVINGIIDDNATELQLSIPSNVEKAVHLVAVNEYREHYALTNIKSAGKRGIEIYLPGAHSDIGGGYIHNENEILYMPSGMPSNLELNNKGSQSFRGFMSFEDLHQKHWITDWAYEKAKKRYLYLWSPKKYSYLKKENETTLKGLTPYRVVNNSYARIPLRIMYNLCSEYIPVANDRVVIYKTGINNYPARTKKNQVMYDSIANLIKVKELLERHANKHESVYRMEKRGFSFKGTNHESAVLLGIRAKYIHLSANLDTVYGIKINAPSENNLRDIYHG